MQKLLFRLLILQLAGAASLLLLVMASISACSVFASTASPTDELPSLQAILPFSNREYPKYVSVLPGGYTYVVDELGPIVVLDGTEVVTMISLPPEDKNNVGYFDRMAIDPQTKMGYLPNANTDNVYVIHDTEMLTALKKVGDGPVSIEINKLTGLTYIANAIDPLGITVLRGTEVVTRIATSFPKTITADPNSSKIYVGQDIVRSSPLKTQGLLAVIDETRLITLTNLGYEQDIPDYLRGDINNIAIDRNSGEIYMIRNLGSVVYMYNDQIKVIKLGSMGYTGLHDIAIDPNRGLAYVSSWGDPKSHVVVLKAGEIVTALPVGTDPRAVVYDEAHDYVYVANRLSHSFSVIRNTEVITTIAARGNPSDIGVDEERGLIYLANPDSHNITVFGFESEINKSSFWDFLPFISR